MLFVFQDFCCICNSSFTVHGVYDFPHCTIQVTMSCVSTTECLDLCVAFYCVAVTPLCLPMNNSQ